MEKIVKDCEDLSKAYDLLRILFFNQWTNENVSSFKEKSNDLNMDLKNSNFIQLIEELNNNMVNEARWDYNRLFVGPEKPLAMPFESSYRLNENLLMGKFTYQVRDYYSQVGIEVQNLNHFPDDFIGFEFQYLYYLSLLIIESYKIDNIEEVNKFLKIRKEFFNNHPKAWINNFSEDIIINSKQTILKEFGIFIKEIMKKEENFLKAVA
ncbi:hypothetical protein CP960_09100 [Malaciobacter halophilus]|uniref:Dehydrogenase n=1 Tax=Malaciobacter halophilus TaxID=197482 RepID=A0A2N1J1R9_9BACT|nr:molecular chaperone TorD family protein [Malaciobacter halophilus]AXH08585.1 anaerobic reductase, chaperone protein [Malaciobacter halophilus]PKI80432.1 hypothetical protein CP960_09100 [Malaciobacter halophilus]